MPHSVKQLQTNIDSCVEYMNEKKEEIISSVDCGEIKFSYDFKEFISTLTDKSDDAHKQLKRQFFKMQEIIACSSQIIERELKRREYQDELNERQKKGDYKLAKAMKKIKKNTRKSLKSYKKINKVIVKDSSSSEGSQEQSQQSMETTDIPASE